MKTNYDNRTLGPDHEGPPRRYREGDEADDFAERAKEYVAATYKPEEVFSKTELHFWAIENGYTKQTIN